MKTINKTKGIILLLVFLFITNCTSSNINECDKNSSIDIGYDSCLFIEDLGTVNNQKETITTIIKETLTLINTKMNITDLRFKVQLSPQNVIPEIGIGGFNPNENEIIISLNSNFSNLTNSILIELPPLVAHEVHHANRRRSVGYGSTLLEACITEGLADSFSIELFNIEPPIWSTALNELELEQWINTASNTWNESGYNHSDWFLGTSTEIPRWTGYSIGFELTQKFLDENSGKLASNLHDEPANSFIE